MLWATRASPAERTLINGSCLKKQITAPSEGSSAPLPAETRISTAKLLNCHIVKIGMLIFAEKRLFFTKTKQGQGLDLLCTEAE